jgi:DNA-binding FadR family transcriptional regulator
VSDVIAKGWPVGELLGSEAELLERYQVSRAVFREAVRLLEHQQVARTRRGPGGGLVITEPTVDAVIDAVVLYLYRVEAPLDELFEARIVLEEIASDLAPGRLDERGLTGLRAFVDAQDGFLGSDPRELHALIASLSRNPALELFVEVLNRVAMLYSSGWQNFGRAVAGETAYAHARIAEAVIDGESGLARHRMGKHLEAEADYLRRRRSTRQLLFVFEPSVSAVTDVAAIYLARRGMRLADLAELRVGVEVAMAGLAASRIDADGVAGLKVALEREAKSSDGERAQLAHSLHEAVAAAANSRVLELVAQVLIRLSRIYEIERLAPRAHKQIRAAVQHAHEGIAAAVESEDRELARHRMRRHLEALGGVMR